jgi:hypothetical protein
LLSQLTKPTEPARSEPVEKPEDRRQTTESTTRSSERERGQEEHKAPEQEQVKKSVLDQLAGRSITQSEDKQQTGFSRRRNGDES